MGDDVHVRLESDIGGHRLADAVGAAGEAGPAMDFVDLNGLRLGVLHRSRSIDILSVEGAGETEIAEIWGRSARVVSRVCRRWPNAGSGGGLVLREIGNADA